MIKLTIVSLSLAAAFGLSAQGQSQYQQPSPNASGSAQQDARFVQQATEQNLAEIEMGKLGAQSKNSQIRQLGTHMESAHQQANKQLQSLAQSQGIPVSERLSGPYRQQIQKLQQLSGKQFDQQYAELTLKHHARAVDLFQREAQQGQNPQLKQYAQSMVPGLQQHLQMAQTAAKDVGVSESTIAGILKQYPAAVGGAQTPGGQGQGAGGSQSGQEPMPQGQRPY